MRSVLTATAAASPFTDVVTAPLAVPAAGTAAFVAVVAVVDLASFTCCVAAAGKNIDDLPLWRIQLSHRSKSDMEKITHRTVRLISILSIWYMSGKV